MKTQRRKNNPLREALKAIEDGESKIREALASIDAVLGKTEEGGLDARA